ncbi:DUF2441 domain-containing protein [Stenotrophomonas sp.]|uniref:DUF2441 domain-containing protein n=1 Tax=Stenotrophomonas sp. TaxID=69392 RepID=UPI0028A62E53|nr:DUF2441 domain-containing protein [Stenotrophomonas sp.]
MARFFHCAPVSLDVGSVILPGDWGRVLRGYCPDSINGLLYRETVLEHVRHQEFQDLPSRLDCVFLLESERDLMSYMQAYARTSIGYEVEVDVVGKVVHRGSWSITLGPHDRAMEATARLAHSYWRGEGIIAGQTEVLVHAPITVARRLIELP